MTRSVRPGSRVAARRLVAAAATAVLSVSLFPTAGALGSWSREAPAGAVSVETAQEQTGGHLVISEVATGGASASDEFVEIYNPSATQLPLEGLELIYVSATGATVTRKAAWAAGAPGVPPGAHVLVANADGAFAAIGDVTYANGLAATGGSVAIRIQGASSAIDAVGWGTAASAWLEGAPAAAHAPGGSLERLPGGGQGSGQDTQNNAVDFVELAVPDPQNASSPPIPVTSPPPTPTAVGSPSPSASASQTPPATPTTSPTATPSGPGATPSPIPAPLSIAAARALPDGSTVTVEGVALTDGSFADGGGCIADGTGGIAVLLSDGTFPRGQRLRVTGMLDDRYHQRTVRASVGALVLHGEAPDPPAAEIATSAVGEAVECQLVFVSGAITSPATQLSGAVAFDFDDGSGATRLVVTNGSGIEIAGWQRGTRLELRGVVGQRDSGGTGAAGYRVMPRDPSDVVMVPITPSPSPSPSASGSSTAAPSASPPDSPGLVSIADARAAAVNTRLRLRGVVTLPTSLLPGGRGVIQDPSGAIVLRIGEEQGQLALGELVEVYGLRSTFSGMETLRVIEPPRRLGTEAQPAATRRTTADVGEADEATLVIVRGAVSTAPRRTTTDSVYFDLDDGSGPLRVHVPSRAGIEAQGLTVGSWIELVGVVGQETSGQQPLRGYRLWPRVAQDLRLLAAADGEVQPEADGATGAGPGTGGGLPLPRAYGGTDGRSGALPELRPPALAAPRLALARPTATPPPGTARGAVRSTQAAGRDPGAVAVLAALLAVPLAAAAAAAAMRPGFLGRVRAAVNRTFGGGGASPTGGQDDLAETQPRADGRVGAEAAAATLVPLSVVDGGVSPGRRPGGSDLDPERGRILPPT